MSQLSANQRYKLANTSLSFKDWLDREKAKGEFIKNSLLEDVVAPYQNNENESNDDQKISSSTGVPFWVVAGGVLIIVGAMIYKNYKE